VAATAERRRPALTPPGLLTAGTHAHHLGTRRWRTVTVHAITSPSFAQASPARLTDDLRGHWAIENARHYLGDTTFAEDASRGRTGTAPQSWPARATWPSTCCAAPPRPVNLAAALWHHAPTPPDPARKITTMRAQVRPDNNPSRRRP
jgi:hypothetical protein